METTDGLCRHQTMVLERARVLTQKLQQTTWTKCPVTETKRTEPNSLSMCEDGPTTNNARSWLENGCLNTHTLRPRILS